MTCSNNNENVHYCRTWTTSNNNHNDNANVQDLDDTFKGEEDQFELKDANEDVAEMVKAVNDSLHQVCDSSPDLCSGSKICQFS